MAMDNNFIITIYGALVASIILFIWVGYLEIRLHRFFRGKDGKSLEGVISQLKTREKDITDDLGELTRAFKKLERINEQDLSRVGIVKFNAFTETGGEQSFSVALLNKEGSGVLLSGIYTRERTGVYTKEVIRYSSTTKLLPEERQAIEFAKNKT